MFPDPGLTIPRVTFGERKQTPDGKTTVTHVPANLPGPVSSWSVGQWDRTYTVTPNLMLINDVGAVDPRLGNAKYSFYAQDKNSRFSIFQTSNGSYIYELYEHDGSWKGGGANLFLSANPLPEQAQLTDQVYYQLDAKISKASASYFTPQARMNGAVLAQVFTGFILQHIDKQTKQGATVFLQIPITNSGSHVEGKFVSCNLGQKGNPTFIFDQLLPGEATLPYAADPGPLHHLQYNIVAHLQLILQKNYSCKLPGVGGKEAYQFTGTFLDPANWKINGMYVGLETQNVDNRPGSKNTSPQGHVEIALQVSNVHIWREK